MPSVYCGNLYLPPKESILRRLTAPYIAFEQLRQDKEKKTFNWWQCTPTNSKDIKFGYYVYWRQL